MKIRFFVLLSLLATGLAAPAVAQDANVSVGSSNSSDPCAAPTAIDPLTALCSVSETDGIVTVVVKSKTVQRGVTLTDATRREQGEVPRTTHRLRRGKNTLRVRVSDPSGRVAVTIDTGRVLYLLPVSEGSALISGPFDGRDAQTTALGGALSVSLITVLMAVRRVTGRDDEPERVA
jgi:hypothetical protein